jgi:hypothetical protein
MPPPPPPKRQDSTFKTYNWKEGALCAYKDDQLQPVSLTMAPTRLAWSNAPRCGAAPSAGNSARDKLDRLWGWEQER